MAYGKITAKQQEILDYFSYALSSCTDKSELTACRDIVNDLMI